MAWLALDACRGILHAAQVANMRLSLCSLVVFICCGFSGLYAFFPARISPGPKTKHSSLKMYSVHGGQKQRAFGTLGFHVRAHSVDALWSDLTAARSTRQKAPTGRTAPCQC